MPPSGFSKQAVKGVLIFLEACYDDLLKEMNKGKIPEEAVQKELRDIRKYLKKFSYDKIRL